MSAIENGEKIKNPPKKRNLFFRLIIGLFRLAAFLFLILLAWITFSAFDRKSPLDLMPKGFLAYLNTPSVYKAVNPLIELEATERLFSASPKLSNLSELLVQLRKSPFRKNPLTAFALSRKMNAAVYQGENGGTDLICAVDLSFLSAVTRLSCLFIPHMKIEGLSMQDGSKMCCYIYKIKDSSFYAFTKKNMIVVSTSYSLLEKSMKGGSFTLTDSKNSSFLLKNDGKPFRIIVDARRALSFAASSDTASQFSELLKEDALSSVSFELSDSSVKLDASFPLSAFSEDSRFLKMEKLLGKDSTIPYSLSRMTNIVQYYTLLNLGSLRELKDAVFPLLPKAKKYDSLWNTASSLTKTMMNNSLEDLLFSWTGKELFAFGVEGLSDPAFALHIADEEKRESVFRSLSSSIIVRDDTSLILDGVRLPRLFFPDFMQNLLRAFGVNLPSPYYMVMDDFVYFSQSPLVLSAVYNSKKEGKHISKNPNWQAVSKNLRNEGCLSLFYDLERSVPFFLKGNSLVTEILSLYSIGRFDIRLSDSVLAFSLETAGRKLEDSRIVAGFSIPVGGEIDGKLISDNSKKKDNIFWLEGKKTVKSYEISSGKSFEFASDKSLWIKETSSKNGGTLWALSDDGAVYLFDKNLKVLDNFPLFLDSVPSCEPSSCDEGLVIPMRDDRICFVSYDGNESFVPLEGSASIKSAPFVKENTVLVYEKGFMGKIYVIENRVVVNIENPIAVPSIAFGSPVMIDAKSKTISFITQNGTFYLWENGSLKEPFPVKLEGVFYSNIVYDGKYIFVLSSDAQLYRISMDGTFTSVLIPNVSAKEGFITVSEEKNRRGNLYIAVDGNVIYGFNRELEVLPGFPLKGYGKPVFSDVNGDGDSDLVLLSLDGTINAWSVK